MFTHCAGHLLELGVVGHKLLDVAYAVDALREKNDDSLLILIRFREHRYRFFLSGHVTFTWHDLKVRANSINIVCALFSEC